MNQSQKDTYTTAAGEGRKMFPDEDRRLHVPQITCADVALIFIAGGIIAALFYIFGG